MIKPILEGMDKKWQITTQDPEEGTIEWLGTDVDTKLMILFRKVNELVQAYNKDHPPIQGNDYLEKR